MMRDFWLVLLLIFLTTGIAIARSPASFAEIDLTTG